MTPEEAEAVLVAHDILLTRKARLSEALFKIHRESQYYMGLTDVGEAHLAAGGSIGPDDMPIGVGMNRYSCCSACSTPSNKTQATREAWPCETVKLLLEAGVVMVSLEYRTLDEQLDWIRP